MDNPLPPSETPNLTPPAASQSFNPWRLILFKPRRAIRQILDEDYGYWVLRLAAFSGLGQALIQLPRLEAAGVSGRLFWGCVFGPLLGILGLYFYGWIYALVGRWLGGTAPAVYARTAIAWSQIPFFIPSLLSGAIVLLFPKAQSVQIGLIFIVFMLTIAAGLWTFILSCLTLAEVHQFSGWRGFFTLFLGNLIVGVIASFIFILIAILIFVAALVFASKGDSRSMEGAPGASLVAKVPEFLREAYQKKDAFQEAKIEQAFEEELPRPETEGPPPSLPDIDFEAYKRTGQKVKIFLTDGKVYEGIVIADGLSDIFLDSAEGVKNLYKSEIQKVEESSL